MLETLRSHRSKFTGILLAGFCALLMIGFGVSTFDGQGRRQGTVATVNDREISLFQLDARHRELSSRLRDQLGENFAQFEAQLNLKQQALDSLITEILIENFTNSLGLTASAEQIEKKILSSPYFRGTYSPAAFDGYLRAIGMTAQQLEQRTRKDLVREQLTAIAKGLMLFTEAELRAIHQAEAAKVSLNYIEISADDFKAKVDTKKESDITAHYDHHKESYRTPKQVRFSFVEFKPEDYLSAVEVAPEDIEAAYRERQSEFFEPAQAHLRRISFSAPKEESKLPFELPQEEAAQSTASGREAKKKSAEAALERLKAGESFADVARAVSEDPQSKSAGGDIGWVSEETLSPEEQEALSELDIQQYSGVIDSATGYSLIFLEEMKKRQDKPLEQVKDIIIGDLKRADAPMYAKISADEFKSKWDASGTPRQPLAEFAKAQGKEMKSSGTLSTAPSAATIPGELFQRALEQNPGDEEVVVIGDNTFVLVIDETKEPTIPELSAVRERVIQELVLAKSRELAEQFGQERLKDLSSKTLAEVATAHQLKLQLSEATTREEAHSGIWSAPGLASVAFSLQEGGKRSSDRLFAQGRKFYLIELAKRELPTDEEFKKSISTVRSEQLSRSGMRMLEALVSVLRAEAKISVDNEVLDAA